MVNYFRRLSVTVISEDQPMPSNIRKLPTISYKTSDIAWPSDLYHFNVVPFPMALGGPVATRCIAGSSALAFINRLALTDSAGAWRGWIEGRSGHQDELLIHVHPSILPCSCGRNDSPRGAHTPPHGGGDRGRGHVGRLYSTDCHRLTAHTVAPPAV